MEEDEEDEGDNSSERNHNNGRGGNVNLVGLREENEKWIIKKWMLSEYLQDNIYLN